MRKILSNRINIILFVFLLSYEPEIGFAQSWKKIASFDGYICFAKFLDENTAFVGLGVSPGRFPTGPVELYKTTTGGKTWIKAVIPSGYGGEIGDVLMVDSLNGWLAATAYQGGNRALWRTTDGGLSWNETQLAGSGTSVTITPAAMIVTDLFQQVHISTNGGKTFSTNFMNSTNCVDFVDSLHGVISCFHGENWLTSSDGGINWINSSMIYEAWSVYGIEGTSEFFAAPEGSYGEYGNVYHSSDYGNTWNSVAQFPFVFTGHLTGLSDKYLVFQVCASGNIVNGATYSGFYVSTDKGSTWNVLGGPCAFNDTRFGLFNKCSGLTLYGFDCLSPGSLYQCFWSPHDDSSSKLLLPEPSTRLIQKNCSQSVDTAIPLSFTGCFPGNPIIDSVWSTNPNFVISDSRALPRMIDSVDSIMIRCYSSTSVDSSQLHILYDFGWGTHDMSISLVDTVTPSFVADSIFNINFNTRQLSASPGDTLFIPVYLNGNGFIDTMSISLPFKLDANLLHPIGFQTSSSNFILDSVYDLNGSEVVLLSSNGLTLNSQTLLGYLRCVVYLTDTLSTSITLPTASLNSSTSPCVALSLATDSIAISIVGCGTKILQQILLGKPVTFGIVRIVPNPAMNEITVVGGTGTFTISDPLGRNYAIPQNGNMLDVSSLPAGVYYVSDGFTAAKFVKG